MSILNLYIFCVRSSILNPISIIPLTRGYLFYLNLNLKENINKIIYRMQKLNHNIKNKVEWTPWWNIWKRANVTLRVPSFIFFVSWLRLDFEGYDQVLNMKAQKEFIRSLLFNYLENSKTCEGSVLDVNLVFHSSLLWLFQTFREMSEERSAGLHVQSFKNYYAHVQRKRPLYTTK
jgi:hypothetical protein